HEPVREWLRALPLESKKAIGRDILTLQYGWPLGMPLARKLEENLWELRTRLGSANARTIFTMDEEAIVLLHAFIKKTRKTPLQDLRIALHRLNRL
ncbi:MAG: type II toxin-antitoxin system RelE/ParE family toxin, partial [Lysobacterales bacterium]